MSAQYRVHTSLFGPNSESVQSKIHSLGENSGSPVRDELHPHRASMVPAEQEAQSPPPPLGVHSTG